MANGKLMQWQASKNDIFRRSLVVVVSIDLHSIGTMMRFHAVKSRQNETLHFLNPMNIIILTRNGKERSKLSRQLCCRGAKYLAIEMNFCVGLSFCDKIIGRIEDVGSSRSSTVVVYFRRPT
jgi:hypothetical protein